MEKTVKVLESSFLYRKIDALPLVGTDRAEVLGALMAVDRLRDVVDNGAVLVARINGWFAPHPVVKHQ